MTPQPEPPPLGRRFPFLVFRESLNKPGSDWFGDGIQAVAWGLVAIVATWQGISVLAGWYTPKVEDLEAVRAVAAVNTANATRAIALVVAATAGAIAIRTSPIVRTLSIALAMIGLVGALVLWAKSTR